MKTIAVIPARMSSTRFPGKPLAKILGIPMLGHVYSRSAMSRLLDDVYIATCDKEIKEYAHSIGAKVIMTKDSHQRASDRTAEAVLKIEQENGSRVDIAVMIQGDEPMLVPEMIDLAIEPLIKYPEIEVVNLMSELKNLDEFEDPNQIKVVVDENDFALYFSREPIPSRKKSAQKSRMLKQVCVIPFRRDFLLKFNELEPTPLEIAESVDMLRVLEHGHKVKMVLSNYQTYSVDTAEDLKRVEGLLGGEAIFLRYKDGLSGAKT